MKLKTYILLIFLGTYFCLNAQDFEVSPIELNFTAEPGQTQSKAITITNHSNNPGTFNIVLQDFELNQEGKKIFIESGNTSSHSLINWLSISPPLIELNPNETKQLVVSIQAPVGDNSTRWTCIFIRNTLEQTAMRADKSVQAGMNIFGQIAVDAYQSPKSNQNYSMKINSLSEITSPHDSVRRFRALVDNIGNKITSCKVSLLASNVANAEETLLQVINFKSFPDNKRYIYLSFNRNKLPAGQYALAAILDYGTQSNLEGAQIIIEN